MRYNGMLLVALIVGALLVAGCSTPIMNGPAPGTATVATQNRVVAVTASQTGDTTGVVTYQGGPGDASLQWIEVSVNNGPRMPIGSATRKVTIGQQLTISGLTGGKDQVVVIGHFTDETMQVLLDTYI